VLAFLKDYHMLIIEGKRAGVEVHLLLIHVELLA
jgi:hypothetical protein